VFLRKCMKNLTIASILTSLDKSKVK